MTEQLPEDISSLYPDASSGDTAHQHHHDIIHQRVNAMPDVVGLAAHEIDTTAVHGITDTALLETIAGASVKVATHEADTTSVHGIVDTAALALTANVVLRSRSSLNAKDYGAIGDSTTNDAAAFSTMFAAGIATRYTNATLHPDGNGNTKTIIEIPAGTYLVTSAEAFMTDLGIGRTNGLTIRGAGREVTNIIFSPTLANKYLFLNNDDLLHITIEDVTFVSTVSTASFMKSYSTGGAQNIVFNRVNWNGTWKYGVELSGTNNNAEMTWFHCGIYGSYSAYLWADSATGTDQFVNYNFYTCQVEYNAGDFINMEKGGNINVWGGSFIHGGSTPQVFFKLGNNVAAHAYGVQRLLVTGTRFELKHSQSKLIDCYWTEGNVSFISCDLSSQTGAAGSASWNQATFAPGSGSMPNIVFDGCSLTGTHEYAYGTGTFDYPHRVTYRNCVVMQWQSAHDFIINTASGANSNHGGRSPVKFMDCYTMNGTNRDYVVFDCTVNWHTATRGVPTKKYASIKSASGASIYDSASSEVIVLPLNSIITRVVFIKPAGGAAVNTNWTYTLTDADALVIAQAAGGGATVWNTAWTDDSGDLMLTVPKLSTTNKRTLTLTSANIASFSYDLDCIIEYLA